MAKWCAPPALAAWCMMETPGAMLRAAEIAGEIAAASPRLGALVMGTTDLTQALGGRATPDRLAVLPSLGLCLLAARAHGLAALDGVHMDLSDDAGLKAACQQGRDLGFDGKTLIPPRPWRRPTKFSPPRRRISNGRAASSKRIKMPRRRAPA